MQCSTASDVIGEVIKIYRDVGVINKSRISVIKKLYEQNIISKQEYENYMIAETNQSLKTSETNKEIRDDDIAKLCEQLIQDGKLEFLNWVQKVLLDTCYLKMFFEKEKIKHQIGETRSQSDLKTLHNEIFKKILIDVPVLCPVLYHNLRKLQFWYNSVYISIPSIV